MIRNIIIAALILFSVSAEAQYNRRQRGLQSAPRQNTQAQKFPEFKPEKAVGITFYDIERVAKKIKLKKASEGYKKATTIFNDFTKEIKQVSRINSFTFLQAKEKIDASQKVAIETKDFTGLQNAYKEVSTAFEPIVKVVEEKEKKLDTQLKKVFSEKQFKKWKKYKEKLKRKGK